MDTPNPENMQGASAETIGARLKAVTDYVQDCERRVVQGEIMDLKGLDANIVELCEAAAALPREQGQHLEAPMQRLIETLDVLAQAIKAQQEKVSRVSGSQK